MRTIRALAVVAGLLGAELASAQVIQLSYSGFSVTLDCARRGPVAFEYTVGPDTGTLPREADFELDPDVPANCEQISDATYSSSYDRGHQVPANHLDHLADGIQQSNFMTNVLPQARNMNRGAWLRTEEIIECHRELAALRVFGGAIYGFNPYDDFFVTSHGVATPDYFWKVVAKPNDVIAWIVPNVSQARRNQLDRYIVSVNELEAIIGRNIAITESLKNIRPAQSWPQPANCDLG